MVTHKTGNEDIVILQLTEDGLVETSKPQPSSPADTTPDSLTEKYYDPDDWCSWELLVSPAESKSLQRLETESYYMATNFPPSRRGYLHASDLHEALIETGLRTFIPGFHKPRATPSIPLTLNLKKTTVSNISKLTGAQQHWYLKEALREILVFGMAYYDHPIQGKEKESHGNTTTK